MIYLDPFLNTCIELAQPTVIRRRNRHEVAEKICIQLPLNSASGASELAAVNPRPEGVPRRRLSPRFELFQYSLAGLAGPANGGARGIGLRNERTGVAFLHEVNIQTEGLLWLLQQLEEAAPPSVDSIRCFRNAGHH